LYCGWVSARIMKEQRTARADGKGDVAWGERRCISVGKIRCLNISVTERVGWMVRWG
jgi:hypothetical protein